MKGAAVSDLHLGYRAYAAMVNGRNAREVDVELAWDRAVATICGHKPDLVTIAGDIFHHPRVGVHAIKAFRDGLRKIVDRTGAEVVVIQGNHDAGRTADVRSPIEIPDDLYRVRVMTTAGSHWLESSAGEHVRVTGLPFEVLSEPRQLELVRSSDADVEVLVIHAPVTTSAEGADRPPAFYAGSQSLDVGRLAETYDVVHAGDFHEFTRLHPDRLAFYSGAIERTTSNVWGEWPTKGVVIYDTADGGLELVPHGIRAIDTGRVVADSCDAEALNGHLAHVLHEGRWRDVVLRFLVSSFRRSERDLIDWKLVRELKRHCLHFQLDLVAAPEDGEGEVSANHSGGNRASLPDQAAAFFRDDPAPVRDCALSYLAEEVAA